MAININVDMLGAKATKTVRALWDLTNKAVLSQTSTLPASPADGVIYIVPASAGSHPKEIAFRSEGAWLYLVPEAGWMTWVVDTGKLMVYNGTAWVEFVSGAGGTTGVVLSAFAGGRLGASETIFRYEFIGSVSFPAGLTGSQGSAGVAATASAVLSLRKNGTQFGTATFAASGTEPTYAAASSTAFVATDVFSIVAPTPNDATLADVALSITSG